MSLVTDCLAAGGTLLVAVGSGLQAGNELGRYKAIATRLGITDFLNAAANYVRVGQRLYRDLYLGGRLGRVPRDVRELLAAFKRYVDALGKLWDSKILSPTEKAEAKALGLKAGYWTLIMIGTALIFAATVVGIVHDLTPPQTH